MRQSVDSVAAIEGIVDLEPAFSQYRELSAELGLGPATVSLADAQGQPLAGITFQTLPTADTPLLINVTGASFDGTLPNLAGISRDQAPFILWNFPDAAQVRVTGGDSLKGTLYAPRAAVRWETTINMEGNVIAASLVHGDQRVAGPR